MTQTIGFIGLGLMGQGFTARLKETGHRVVGFDIDAAKVAQAKAIGVEPAASPAEVAKQADIVLVCVINTAAVEDVVSGPNGIVAAGPARRQGAGRSFDHRNRGDQGAGRGAGANAPAWPSSTRRCRAARMRRGPARSPSWRAAKMPRSARWRPLMEKLGRFTHMGAVGAGQATKLVNQTLVLTNYCVIAEAVRLAQAYGVDAKKIPEALARRPCRLEPPADRACPHGGRGFRSRAAMRARSSRISKCCRRPRASITSRCRCRRRR